MYFSTQRRLYKRRQNEAYFTKILFTRDLQKDGEIDNHQIRSNGNLVDMFTMLLPAATLEKLTYGIELPRLRDIN